MALYTFDDVKEQVASSIGQLFPIARGDYAVTLDDVTVSDRADENDLPKQYAKATGQGNWTVPVYAHVTLRGPDGPIHKGKVRVLSLPKLTSRKTFVVGGKEQQLHSVIRRKSGIYTHRNEAGELVTEFNLDNGLHSGGRIDRGKKFHLHFDEDAKKFKVRLDTLGNIDAYNLLKLLGMDDDQLKASFGEKIHAANANIRPAKKKRDTWDIYRKIYGRQAKPKGEISQADMEREIKNSFRRTQVSPDTTEFTLGKRYESVDKDAILDAMKKLVQVARGDVEEDDRESFLYKRVVSPPELIGEAISHKLNMRSAQAKVKERLGRKKGRKHPDWVLDDVKKAVPPSLLDRSVHELIGGSDSTEADMPSYASPTGLASGYNSASMLGTGAIGSLRAIPREAPLLSPSHLGFIDPSHTPESGRVGISLHLAKDVVFDKGKLKTLVRTPSGESKYISAEEAARATIAFPDEYDLKPAKPKPLSKKVKAQSNGQIEEVNPKDVDYILHSPGTMSDVASNIIPFLQSDQGNRAMFAGKHSTQALPLKYREPPLVQSGGEHELEEFAGVQRSPIDGTVSSIRKTDGAYLIYIRPKGKKRPVLVRAYKDYPMPNGIVYDSDVKVKPGDTVKKGDLLADSTFTKDGQLAMGSNLRVAYMPWHGKAFDDGIVVSDKAAEKLTSIHLHEIAKDSGDLILDKDKFLDWFRSKFDSQSEMNLLDQDGVVRKGAKIKPGQIIFAGLQQPEVTSPEAKERSKFKLSPYNAITKTWDHDVPGVVTDVRRTSKGKVRIFVKTEEPARVGDKLVGRHGNKGVIVAVEKHEEMPHTKDGEPVDVILTPLGVPGRINVGQVLETAAARVAEKTGAPVIASGFKKANRIGEVRKMLRDAGLPEDEELVDPVRGNRSYGKVFTGPQYLYKLNHQVAKKLKTRARSSYDRWDTPAGGKSGAQTLGELGTNVMLAHGAIENLRDVQLYKSQHNDELWDALVEGRPLPTPKHITPNDRFEALLRVAGVKMEKGDVVQLVPQTDKQTKELARNRPPLKDPARMFMFRNNRVRIEKEGLFDPKKTGGEDGTSWSYFELPEPVPNPLFEAPIKALTGLSKGEFDDIVSGKKKVNGKTGGPAIKEMLSSVNLSAQEKSLRAAAKKIAGSKRRLATRAKDLSALYKKLRYVQALKEKNLRPEDVYLMQNVPVMPPKLRPVLALGTGQRTVDDMNSLYRDLALVGDTLRESKAENLEDSHYVQPLRAALYDGLSALLQASGSKPPLSGDYQGVLGVIGGKRPKGKREEGPGPKKGLFQNQIMRRRQDFSARSTITPEPQLKIDNVGMPFEMAYGLYEPWIRKKLSAKFGLNTRDARLYYDEKGPDDPRIRRVMQEVVNERPVLMKRDPALHKFNVLSFDPVLVDGKSIRIHPLVTSGYNADFDGDDQIGSVLVLVSDSQYDADKVFWSVREIKMSARFREVVGATNGHFCVCNLEDFPRTEKIGEKDHIEFYRVPDGIRVIALDEQGTPVATSVFGWSVHRDREVEIVTLGSGRQIITDDDERAVFGLDADTLMWCRRRPSESDNQFVPVVSNTSREIEKTIEFPLPHDPSGRLREEATPTLGFGYLLGSMIGDGWFSHTNGRVVAINFSTSCRDVEDRWKESILSIFNEPSTSTGTRNDDDRLSKSGGNFRTTVACTAAAVWLADAIGHGTGNKHLPPNFLGMSENVQLGILGGLWDTGGSMSWSGGKKKPQFMCSYSSTSLRLVQEIQRLLQTFGVSSRLTSTSTTKGNPAWLLNVSIVDLYGLGGFPVSHPEKMAAQAEFMNGPPPDRTMAYSRYRLVPTPPQLAKELRSIVGSSRRGMYTTLSCAMKRKYVSKERALKILDVVQDRCSHPLFSRWREIVTQRGVHYERVKEVVKTGIKETGYDLTVPGFETFMSTDGIVLSNTMSIYVPLSEQAVEEAQKMKPSNNMFSPARGGVVHAPSHEMVWGLAASTKLGKKTNKSFDSHKSARESWKRGEIDDTDQIKIGGRKTTMGWENLNSVLPPRFRFRGDVERRAPVDKRRMNELLERIAKKEPGVLANVVDDIKDLGNSYSTRAGLSFTLDDFTPIDPEYRDRVFADAEKKSKTARNPIKVLGDALVDVDKHTKQVLESGKKENAVYDMFDRGARGKWGQLKQILSAPALVFDARERIVPRLIRKSFGEGLDMADYWTHLHGARKGAIAKSVATSRPGYLSKQVTRTVLDQVVTEPDCGTRDGVGMATSDNSILGRYLASSIRISGPRSRTIKRGTLITPDIVKTLKAHKISNVQVRSPLRCEVEDGVCSKCMGVDEENKDYELGTNVGVIAAQSIGEPGTQLSMRVFHCNHAHSLVFVRNRIGVMSTITMEDLFHQIESSVDVVDGEEIKKVSGLQIYEDGRWVELTHIRRHIPERPMRLVSDGGLVTICQDNHPLAVFENLTRCVACGYHRLKKPSPSTGAKRPYCSNCGKYQDPSQETCGQEEYVSPSHLLPKRYYLRRDLRPVLDGGEEKPPSFPGYVAGMYLAEGCIDFRYSSSTKIRKPYSVSFAQLKGPVRDRLEELLPWQVQFDERALHIHSLDLGEEFLQMFRRYSFEKRLPPDFLGYPTRWLADCLAGLIDGNGCIGRREDGPDTIDLDTTSFALAQQVVFICAKLGLVGTICATTWRKLSKNQGYKVRIRATKQACALLSASVKVRGVAEFSPDQQVELYGERLITTNRSVEYTHDYVYDATTSTGLLCVGGLKSHNTGGVVEDPNKKLGSDRLGLAESLMRLTKNLPNKAILSPRRGKIEKVEKAEQGGYDLTIDGAQLHVPSGKKLRSHVREGEEIGRGAPLTHGLLHPMEVMKYRGAGQAQKALVDQLHQLYEDVSSVKKKHFELVVRKMSNYTRVLDPGSSTLERGQPVLLAKVKKHNAGVKKQDKIRHLPIFKGVDMAPLVSEDWLARLGSDRLRSTIIGAATQGWRSSPHSAHPIPSLTFLAEEDINKNTGFGRPLPTVNSPY